MLSLTASNLDPSRAIKTDSTSRLITSNLEISDVDDLQASLDAKISTPYIGTLQASSVVTDGGADLDVASGIAIANQTTVQNLTHVPGVPSKLSADTDIDLLDTRSLKRAKLVETERVSDASGASVVDFTPTNVDVVASDVTVNGSSLVNLIGRAVNITSAVDGVETQIDGFIHTAGKGIFDGGISATGLANDMTGTLSMFSDIEMFGNGVLNAGTMTADDVNATTFVDTAQYREGGTPGEILKVKNVSSVYGGPSAGFSLSASTSATMVGYEAGATADGNNNASFGYRAGYGALGNNTTAIGANALGGSTTGTKNTAVGSSALGNLFSTSTENTAIGSTAGSSLTIGSRNVCIGAGSSVSNNSTNSTTLGASVIGDDSDQVMLGDNQVTQVVNQGDGVCDVGTATHRFKDANFSGNVNCVTINGNLPGTIRSFPDEARMGMNTSTVASFTTTQIINIAKTGTFTPVWLNGIGNISPPNAGFEYRNNTNQDFVSDNPGVVPSYYMTYTPIDVNATYEFRVIFDVATDIVGLIGAETADVSFGVDIEVITAGSGPLYQPLVATKTLDLNDTVMDVHQEYQYLLDMSAENPLGVLRFTPRYACTSAAAGVLDVTTTDRRDGVRSNRMHVEVIKVI